MSAKATLDEERQGLIARVAELRQLITSEWLTMSWQVAREREEELLSAETRIKAIERAAAKRKRASV